MHLPHCLLPQNGEYSSRVNIDLLNVDWWKMRSCIWNHGADWLHITGRGNGSEIHIIWRQEECHNRIRPKCLSAMPVQVEGKNSAIFEQVPVNGNLLFREHHVLLWSIKICQLLRKLHPFSVACCCEWWDLYFTCDTQTAEEDVCAIIVTLTTSGQYAHFLARVSTSELEIHHQISGRWKVLFLIW